MASFGDEESAMTSSYYTTMQGTQPLKRVDPSVQKFTKIVIPTDLERLRQHKTNIEKFQRQKNWEKLTTEQVNARRTVQQLKANIREMEKTRSLIIEEDLRSFDSRVSPVKEEAIHAVVQFIELTEIDQTPLQGAHSNSDGESSLRKRHIGSAEEHEVANSDGTNLGTMSNSTDETKDAALADVMQQQVQLQSKSSIESWENLRKELMSLNSLIHEFATYVRAQGETVDNIADNIDSAEHSVATGRRHLIKASTLKAAIFPLGGAIIGGCLGGPVGLYAGLKVGTMAAIGGSAIGFVGGRFLKKKKDKQASIELENMDKSSLRRVSDPGPSRE